MPFASRGFGFINQVQLTCLIAFQQGDHDIDSRPAPAAYFILKPVPSSWPSRNGQPAAPRTNNPEQFRRHDLSLDYLSRKLIDVLTAFKQNR